MDWDENYWVIWATGPKIKERPRKAGKDWPSLKTLILNGCTLSLSDPDVSCRRRLTARFCKDAAWQREGETGIFSSSERECNLLDNPTVMSLQTMHPIASVSSFPHGSCASDDGAVCCLVSLWITIKQASQPHSHPQSTSILHTDWLICISVCDCFLFFFLTDVVISLTPHYVTELCLISSPVETPQRELTAAWPQCLSEWQPCGGNVLSMSKVSCSVTLERQRQLK